MTHIAKIKADERLTLKAEFKDSNGVPIPIVDHKPTWKFEASHFDAAFSEDGLECTLKPTGALGYSTVTARYNSLVQSFVVGVEAVEPASMQIETVKSTTTQGAAAGQADNTHAAAGAAVTDLTPPQSAGAQELPHAVSPESASPASTTQVGVVTAVELPNKEVVLRETTHEIVEPATGATATALPTGGEGGADGSQVVSMPTAGVGGQPIDTGGIIVAKDKLIGGGVDVITGARETSAASSETTTSSALSDSGAAGSNATEQPQAAAGVANDQLEGQGETSAPSDDAAAAGADEQVQENTADSPDTRESGSDQDAESDKG